MANLRPDVDWSKMIHDQFNMPLPRKRGCGFTRFHLIHAPWDCSVDFEFSFCGDCEEKGESVPPIRSLTSLLTSSRSLGTGDLEAGICMWGCDVWGCEGATCEGVYQSGQTMGRRCGYRLDLWTTMKQVTQRTVKQSTKILQAKNVDFSRKWFYSRQKTTNGWMD